MVIRLTGAELIDDNEARLKALVSHWAKAENYAPETAWNQLVDLATEPENRHTGFYQNFVWVDFDESLIIRGYAAVRTAPLGLELLQEWTEQKNNMDFYREIDGLLDKVSEQTGLPVVIVSRRAVSGFIAAERIYGKRGFERIGVVYARPPKVAGVNVPRETVEVG